MSIPRLKRTTAAVSRIPRRPIQSRTEAAAELVRLEYERDRLLTDIAALCKRLDDNEAMLERNEARMRFLQVMLAIEDGAAAPPPPPPPPPVAKAPRFARDRREARR
jgi:hypothetical protein